MEANLTTPSVELGSFLFAISFVVLLGAGDRVAFTTPAGEMGAFFVVGEAPLSAPTVERYSNGPPHLGTLTKSRDALTTPGAKRSALFHLRPRVLETPAPKALKST